MTDRFREASNHVNLISSELSNADKKLAELDDHLEFLFSNLMSIAVEDAADIKDDFDVLRDELANALITQSTMFDKFTKLFGKIEALVGHGYEASELYIEARTKFSLLLTDLSKFRGENANNATVMMALLNDEMFQHLIASDDESSWRMLNLIGGERVEAWLSSHEGSST